MLAEASVDLRTLPLLLRPSPAVPLPAMAARDLVAASRPPSCSTAAAPTPPAAALLLGSQEAMLTRHSRASATVAAADTAGSSWRHGGQAMGYAPMCAPGSDNVGSDRIFLCTPVPPALPEVALVER